MIKRAFVGCEAFLYKVTALRECRIWLGKPNQPSLLYADALSVFVNLAQTPLVGLDKATVDDYVGLDELTSYPGLTTLGPEYPGAAKGAGAKIGHASDAGIWLEEKQEFEKYLGKPELPEWPPTKPVKKDRYRYRSVIYCDKADGLPPFRRYLGYRAMLLGSAGNDALLTVWNADDEPPTKPGTQVKINVTNPGHVDMSESAVFSKPGDVGALYLRWTFASAAGLASPKLPIGEGTTTLPNG